MDHFKKLKFNKGSVKIKYIFSSVAAGHGYNIACSLYNYSNMCYTYYIKEYCTELNYSDIVVIFHTVPYPIPISKSTPALSQMFAMSYY